MMVTLVFQYRFAGTKADDSFYQLYVADTLHEGFLFVRSCILYSKSNRHIWLYQLIARVLIYLGSEKCYHFMYDPPLIIVKCMSMFVYSWMLTVLFYGTHIMKYTLPVLCTFLVTWFIARYCDGAVLCYRVDTITVHLLIWQCVGLMCLANTRTSMVLTIASSRIYLCPLRVCGLLHIRVLDSISIRPISCGFGMVSVHL